MGDDAIRVSDAERDSAATALWTHYEAGRLTPAEHEDRCARAAAAATRADLEALFADLPAPHPGLAAVSGRPRPGEIKPTVRSEVLAIAGMVVLVSGITAAVIFTILEGMWWLFFPAIGVAVWLFVLSDKADEQEREQGTETV